MIKECKLISTLPNLNDKRSLEEMLSFDEISEYRFNSGVNQLMSTREIIERLKQIEEWIEKREIKFTGYIYKTGKKGKRAVILMLFPDESKRSYSRDSEKVDELREWVKQVQKEFSECDWSGFDYKLR